MMSRRRLMTKACDLLSDIRRVEGAKVAVRVMEPPKRNITLKPEPRLAHRREGGPGHLLARAQAQSLSLALPHDLGL